MKKLCFLLLTLGVAAEGSSAESDKRVGNLYVAHREAAVYNTSRGVDDEERTKLESRMSYRVREGETLAIYISDANPLLYTYSWSKDPDTETADYKTAQSFAKALATFGKGLAQLAADAVDEAPALDPSAISAVTESVRRYSLRMPSFVAPRPQRISANECIRRGAKLEIKELAEWSLAIADLAEYVDAFPKTAATSIDATEAQLTDLKREAAEVLIDAKTAAGAVDKIDTYHAALIAHLGASAQDVAKFCGENAANIDMTGLATDQFTLQTLLITAQRANIAESIATAEEIANRVNKLGENLFLGELSFDATKDVPGTLTIGTTAAFDDLTEKQRAALRKSSHASTGKFQFVARPYTPVGLKIGPALIYSFVERPDYKAVPENDKFRITRSDEGDEVSGQELGAMLTLTPSRWSNPIFEPSFQIGLVPDTDNLGIFGGVGFALYRNLYLGGGIAYQQVPELVPALHDRDLIDSADDLKTSSQFKTGLYLTLSVNFDIK